MDLREYILTSKIKNPRYTSKYLAEKLGVSQNVISRWSSKKCIPDTKTVYAIFKATDGNVALEDWIKEDNMSA
jgi:transcriptional regulator with XRE-family HTH domain